MCRVQKYNKVLEVEFGKILNYSPYDREVGQFNLSSKQSQHCELGVILEWATKTGRQCKSSRQIRPLGAIWKTYL